MNARWEDDGLWATDPAAEEVSRMLDAICPRCDGPAHEGACAFDANGDALDELLNRAYYQEMGRYCPRCDSLWYVCDCAEHDMALLDKWDEMREQAIHDQRADDVETGIPMRHARPDDEWEND